MTGPSPAGWVATRSVWQRRLGPERASISARSSYIRPSLCRNSAANTDRVFCRAFTSASCRSTSGMASAMMRRRSASLGSCSHSLRSRAHVLGLREVDDRLEREAEQVAQPTASAGARCRPRHTAGGRPCPRRSAAEQAELLVVADGARGHAEPLGDLPDADAGILRLGRHGALSVGRCVIVPVVEAFIAITCIPFAGRQCKRW